MNVGELCNRDVVFATRDTGLIEAARRMREHHVGSLVVVAEQFSQRVPIGMITDRDIVVAEQMDGFVRTLRSERAREARVRR